VAWLGTRRPHRWRAGQTSPAPQPQQNRQQEVIDVERASEEIITNGPLTINMKDRTAYLDGERLPTTPLPFRMLCQFMRDVGKTLDCDEILTRVWGTGKAGDKYCLRMASSQLRRDISVISVRPLRQTRDSGI
jgi:DNA-binding response OmpR family regulator